MHFRTLTVMEYSAFSAHLELEKAFRRNPFLTSGPRIDFFKPEHNRSAFFIGYDLKLYPLMMKHLIFTFTIIINARINTTRQIKRLEPRPNLLALVHFDLLQCDLLCNYVPMWQIRPSGS